MCVCMCYVKRGKVNYKYSNLLENSDEFKTFWPVIRTSGTLKELIWLYNNLSLWKQQSNTTLHSTLGYCENNTSDVTATGCHGSYTACFLCDITVVLTVGIHPYKAVTSQPPVCLVTIQTDRYYPQYTSFMPIPVAVPSKAWVCGHSLAEIVGSNPTGGMDVSC